MKLLSRVGVLLACSAIAMSLQIVPAPYCLCGTAYKLALSDPAQILNAIPRLVSPLTDSINGCNNINNVIPRVVSPLADTINSFRPFISTVRDRFDDTFCNAPALPQTCGERFEFVRPAPCPCRPIAHTPCRPIAHTPCRPSCQCSSCQRQF